MGDRTKQLKLRFRNNIDVDPSHLPVEIDLSANRFLCFFGLVFGGFWLVPSFSIFTGDIFQEPENIIVVIFFLAGLGIVLCALYFLLLKRSVTLQQHGVEYFRSLPVLGTAKDFVAYDKFQGVMLDEYIRQRSKSSDLVYQTVKLKHADDDFSVTLYQVEGTVPPRERWKAYSRTFDLPALEDDGDGFLVRQPHELDLSLQELSERQVVYASDYNREIGPTPNAFVLSETGTGLSKQLEILFVAPRIPTKWYPFIVGISLLFLIVPYMVFAAGGGFSGWFFIFVFSIAVLIAGGVVWIDRSNNRKLVISRDTMSIEDEMPFGAGVGAHLKDIALADIDSIVIDDVAKSGKQVVVNGKRGRLFTGPGLEPEAQNWLKRYLRAAVVTA